MIIISSEMTKINIQKSDIFEIHYINSKIYAKLNSKIRYHIIQTLVFFSIFIFCISAYIQKPTNMIELISNDEFINSIEYNKYEAIIQDKDINSLSSKLQSFKYNDFNLVSVDNEDKASPSALHDKSNHVRVVRYER